MGDLKKKLLQALIGRKKLHAAQLKEKKILALLQENGRVENQEIRNPGTETETEMETEPERQRG